MSDKIEYLDFYKSNFSNGKYCTKSWGLASYQAGAQSRQAEIDELQKKLAYQENAYKNVKLQFLNKDDDFNELQAMYEKQGLYAFELQKRIDKLIPLLERYNYAGWIKILKGNQNEN